MSLIIVANREPLREDGGKWSPSVGGLTTALLPVLEKRGGKWIGWGEKRAREEPVLFYPEEEARIEIRRLVLSERQLANYYYGMANRVLWPLSHYFIERMNLRRGFYEDYRRVNRTFAHETIQAMGPNETVWVQDYHLMLVPEYIRRERPGARIGFFYHIPWPAPEVWRVLPQAEHLLEGLLGADLVGFHIQEYVDNFLGAASTLLGAEVRGNTVKWKGRKVRVEAHPIGIDAHWFRHMSYRPEVRFESMRLRRESSENTIILGVDRLDYTKGILERLLAYEQFLRSNPRYRGKVTFYQIATPSRTRVESYRQLKRQVDEIVGRINGSFMRQNWVPVVYHYRSFSQEQLVSFYRAADVALIPPLRDGMNLVAMEFIAASEDGVLVLSDLAGAASLLPETIHVNPYDVDKVVKGLKRALDMPERERYSRLSSLKKRVEALDVFHWAEKFLDSLET